MPGGTSALAAAKGPEEISALPRDLSTCLAARSAASRKDASFAYLQIFGRDARWRHARECGWMRGWGVLQTSRALFGSLAVAAIPDAACQKNVATALMCQPMRRYDVIEQGVSCIAALQNEIAHVR